MKVRQILKEGEVIPFGKEAHTVNELEQVLEPALKVLREKSKSIYDLQFFEKGIQLFGSYEDIAEMPTVGDLRKVLPKNIVKAVKRKTDKNLRTRVCYYFETTKDIRSDVAHQLNDKHKDLL